MDMRQKNKLSVTDKLMKKIHVTNDGCWIWRGERKTTRRPRFTIRNGGKEQCFYVHRHLYQEHYGEVPKELENTCNNPILCVNPEHMQRTQHTIRKPNDQRGTGKKRMYQQHNDNCGGIDEVLVYRIVSAGTINVVPKDHTICNCERAYIALNFDRALEILQINTTVLTQLRKLGDELWNQ